MYFKGGPKTKFLRLFLSAVRPSVRPKKLLLTLPLSALHPPPCPGANPINWGQSYTVVYTLGQTVKARANPITPNLLYQN